MDINVSDELVDLLIEEGLIEKESDLEEMFEVQDRAQSMISTLQERRDDLNLQGHFMMSAYDKAGQKKWNETFTNLVVNEGLNYALSVGLNGGIQSPTWYLGLVNSGPTFDASDTLSSHSGWTENTDYSESARQEWDSGSVSAQSIDNSGGPAEYSINAATDVAGAFLTDDNTKGGTSGTLFAEGSFSSTRSLEDGDTVKVTYTINAS